MRLRAKLTLIIAMASVVPIVAAALVGRDLVQRQYRAEFGELLGDGRVEVNKRFDAMKADVSRVVDRMADHEDPFIGRILLDLARGGADDQRFRNLVEEAPRVMRSRGLDILTVLSPGGRILASGHFPGRQGDTDRSMSLAARKTRSSARIRLLPARVMDRGKPVTRLTVQVWRRVRSELGVEVIVVGGRALGPGFVGRLNLRGGTKVLIESSAGQRLAGPADWSRYLRYPSQVVRLRDLGGKEAARIILAVPDDRLRHTLEAINITAGALMGSGIALSLILGLVLARRISRPMQELVRGARAVAHGELELELPVRSKDEIGDLVQAFNRMTTDLRDSKEKLMAAERVAAWREIARRIAHEIKNPLFPIQTSIETLRKAHLKQHPEFEEIFDESTVMILEEVNRLKNIASEFSRFARMPKPSLVPCSVGEVVTTVASLYSSEDVPITCELQDDLPRVLGDREQLTQVFSNLVKNAGEALKEVETPRILISARAGDAGDLVEVRVTDNGPGISAEVEDKIFTPYFTTKGASGGSGLGLAIVHRIVMDHHGRIEARSEGGGAAFTVHLPLADDPGKRGRG